MVNTKNMEDIDSFKEIRERHKKIHEEFKKCPTTYNWDGKTPLSFLSNKEMLDVYHLREENGIDVKYWCLEMVSRVNPKFDIKKEHPLTTMVVRTAFQENGFPDDNLWK
jgi:hypothetical protein